MSATIRGLGILIERFSEFLQRLFEGNRYAEANEKELDKILKTQGNLSIAEALEVPFEKLQVKLEKIDTNHLDRLVVLLYDRFLTAKKGASKRLEHTVLQLVYYLDEERGGLSPDRSNIKNSLLHRN